MIMLVRLEDYIITERYNIWEKENKSKLWNHAEASTTGQMFLIQYIAKH